MYKNISAEFQTANDADIVARKIKETIEGIKRVSINYKTKDFKPSRNSSAIYNYMGTYNMAITGTFLPVDYEYYGVKNMPNFTSVGDALEYDYSERIEGNKGSIINIVCQENQVDEVEKKLIAYGGLNITK